MNKDTMDEIARNIADAITTKDIDNYPAPRVFNKALYVGAMQALKHGAGPRFTEMQIELNVTKEALQNAQNKIKELNKIIHGS